MLVEAARDPAGQVIDFVYREVSRATCDYWGVSRAELIGTGMLESTPGIKELLLAELIHCLQSGEPLILNDFSYDNEILQDTRRYDLRATRANADYIVLTWRDVTERYESAERLAASEARYRSTMDSSAVPMCLTDPDGRFTEVNDAMCRFIGYDAPTLTAMTWLDLLAPEFVGEAEDDVERLLSGEVDSYRGTRQFIHADGHRVWGDLSVACMRNPDGEFEYFIAQAIDVTKEVALTEALQRQNKLLADSEATYRLLAENAGDLVCHIRKDGAGDNQIAWISPSVEAVLGTSPKYWVGRPLREFVLPEDVETHAERWKLVDAGQSVSQRVRIRSVHGDVHWFHVNLKPFHDAEGHHDGAVIGAHLVDDEVAAEQVAEEARRQQVLADERFRRAMDNANIGMCLMDSQVRPVEVNEALCRFLGYDADTLLHKTWQQVSTPEAVAASQKALDEVLAGRTDSFRMINQYVHADGHLMWADRSVSCVRDEDGNVESFIVAVTDVTPVERELRERLEFEDFLSCAITEGRLLAYAQPIVAAHTGELVEEELLVRMVAPDGRITVPDEFLPQARRFGLMPTIDRFMVSRAVELARAGRRVAVNISAATINDAATIAAVIEHLRHAGEAAHRVSFEITEHTALVSTDLARRFSDDVQALGCRLALDDFGTGFGSFTELRGMTVHTLKIDRSFVTDMLSNPQDESVVRAIVRIADEFGLITTAEGIEDHKTRDRLVELGVDQLQGYAIGYPAPAMTAEKTPPDVPPA